VDKTGAAIDVQAAALDWLITDARQHRPTSELAEHKAIKDLLKSEGET
jgi:mannose-1-phosphate guanylyltransferase